MKTRVRAAGTLAGLAPGLEQAFSPGPGFGQIWPPVQGDWLWDHDEAGQSFDAYIASRPNRPAGARRVIYILPIGPFDPDRTPPIEMLSDFVRAHFGMTVRLIPPVPIAEIGAKTRPRETGEQLLAPDVLTYLRSVLPRDAYCLIGVTSADLYPDDDWSFVFGMAGLRERVGIYSVARFHPAFQGEADHYPDPDRWVLRRSVKVMAHEIGHMFGMEHCIYYECVMNGSNHLEETDQRPAHLCPICLRKLHNAVKFAPAERYRALERFFRAAGLGPEAEWNRARADELTGSPSGRTREQVPFDR